MPVHDWPWFWLINALIFAYIAVFFASHRLLWVSAVAGGFGVVMLWAGVLAARERRRSKWGVNGQCPACGYDLRATPHKCPECGHAPPHGVRIEFDDWMKAEFRQLHAEADSKEKKSDS